MRSLTTLLVTIFLNSIFLQAQWSSSDLSSARFNIGIAEANGMVFFAGSWPPSQAQVLDIYDMGSNQWTTLELAVSRQFTFAEAIGNSVYFAGHSQSQVEDQDIIEIYDTTSETWSTIEMPDLGGATSMTSSGDLLLVVNGDQVRMYNTASNEWSSATLSVNRILAEAIACNGKVLFAGGGSLSNGVHDVVDIYDVDSDSWSATTMSEAKNQIEVACLKDKIYLVGGATDFSAYSDAIEVYDTETESWTLMQMSQVKSSVGVAATDNNLYISGGREEANFDYVTEIEIINGITGEKSFDDLSSPRSATSNFGAGNVLFIAGGFDPDEVAYITSIQIFTEEVPSGISDTTFPQISLSPNPSTDYVTIVSDKLNSQLINYAIYDATGAQVLTGTADGKIDISELSTGIYSFQILNKDYPVLRLVKQ